jgi:hypothetical protein
VIPVLVAARPGLLRPEKQLSELEYWVAGLFEEPQDKGEGTHAN